MSTPLHELLTSVFFDSTARSTFEADPDGFLHRHGWSELDAAELREAVASLGDALPIETTLALEDACEGIDFSSTAPTGLGTTLADVVDRVEPDLPISQTIDELDFGAGADDAAEPASDIRGELDELLDAGGDEAPEDDTELDLDFDDITPEPAFDEADVAPLVPDEDVDPLDEPAPNETDIDLDG